MNTENKVQFLKIKKRNVCVVLASVLFQVLSFAIEGDIAISIPAIINEIANYDQNAIREQEATILAKISNIVTQ
jgi:hypothetical protein